MSDDLSFPASWKMRPPHLAEDAPHPSNVSGRPLNPDTGLPYPSASQAQLELADELLARLVDDGVGAGLIAATRNRIRDALVEVVVRQHGRTLRACIDELRAQADENDRQVRDILADAVADDGTVSSGRVAAANTLTLGSTALRYVLLRGGRA